MRVECQMCFEEFEAERKSRKFCSDACRQRAWRQAYIYNWDGDLPELLEATAAQIRQGRSPLRNLKRIRRVIEEIAERDWVQRLPRR